MVVSMVWVVGAVGFNEEAFALVKAVWGWQDFHDDEVKGGGAVEIEGGLEVAVFVAVAAKGGEVG